MPRKRKEDYRVIQVLGVFGVKVCRLRCESWTGADDGGGESGDSSKEIYWRVGLMGRSSRCR